MKGEIREKRMNVFGCLAAWLQGCLDEFVEEKDV